MGTHFSIIVNITIVSNKAERMEVGQEDQQVSDLESWGPLCSRQASHTWISSFSSRAHGARVPIISLLSL